MKSVAVGLARQGVFAAGLGALLIGAIYSGTNGEHRPGAARQSAIAPPLQVRSVVVASAAAPPIEAAAAAPQSKTQSKGCAGLFCARAVAAKTQLVARPTPERTTAPPIVLASATEPERDFGLARRFFGPVDALRGQVDLFRGQVARLFWRP